MKIAAALFALAIATGLFYGLPATEAPHRMGEYNVLSSDFHLHSFPLDVATLSPWDVVVEARRRGLHVIALTGHNHTFTAYLGRWFSELTGGPLVLIGEEVITPPFDVIAVGIRDTVDFRGNSLDVVRRIHEQGGIAIAAHPIAGYWPGLDIATQEFDGAEVLHPTRFDDPQYARELDEFFARKPMSAIGSSDFHATGYPGFSRTYVFAREVSERGVLDALRERHTVVVDQDGSYIGDPELIALAKALGGLKPAGRVPPHTALSVMSRYAALAAMLAACWFGFRRERLS